MADDPRGPASPVPTAAVSRAPQFSPEWWADRLHQKIKDDVPTMDIWWRYFEGDHPFPKMPDKVRDKVQSRYSEILKRANANFMAVAIDAVTERCRPVGFRLGADSNFQTDLKSWEIWQASYMDADAPLAIETALARGRSFMSVWFHDGDPLPTIAAEDPSQCIVEHVPGSRHRRAAGLKVYLDEWTGQERADLFLAGENGRPGMLHKLLRDSKRGGRWSALPREEDPVPNPAGYTGVPIVPIYHRPRLTYTKLTHRRQLKWGGDSHIADVTAIQDRINETILNRVIAQWFAAFRQRYATGLVVEETPLKDAAGNVVTDADGKPVMVPEEPFDTYLDRLWAVDDPNVKFGDLGATDISQYLKTHERDLQDLSTIKRIPRHYLFQEGQSPSGDAIKSAETGLVALVKRVHLNLGDPLEETNRVARIMSGGDLAAPSSEMVWADPEYQTYGQLVDGVLKEYQSGLVPWEGAMEKLGYTPMQIARYRGQRNVDSLLRALEDQEPEGEPIAA